MSEHNEETDFSKEELPEGVVLMDHSYDGIREYDQRLPRWWLITLYGAIIFACCYWFVSYHYAASKSPSERVDESLAAIATKRLESSFDVTDNSIFWEMSENANYITSGEAIFQANCSPCHGADLKGGIGFNLVDGTWVHGAQPSSIFNTITHGVPDKGMQAWGDVLGQTRISQVVAYILSKNDRSVMEEAIKVNP